jgi:hypothetical protein
MILETSLILGSAIALIAVQPPLRKLFPERPKQTEWEKFWAGREEFWRERVEKPKSGTLGAFERALKLNLDYTKQALDNSAKLFQEIKAAEQTPTSSFTRENFELRNEQNKPLGTLMIQTERGIKEVTPAGLDAALSKAVTIPRSTWTDGLSQAQSWQTPDRNQAIQDRAAFAAEAERRGMQVYLDHATNEYRARETQLSRNLAALEAALGKGWSYDFQEQTYTFPGNVTVPRSAVEAAKNAEDVWRLISDKPAPTQLQMNLLIIEEELKRMRWENKPRIIVPEKTK